MFVTGIAMINIVGAKVRIFVGFDVILPKMLQVSEKLLNFAANINRIDMSQKEKEEKAKEFWEYYEATQGTITITDPVVLD